MLQTLEEIAKYIGTNDLPQAGTKWKHYKGGLYVVICTGIRESNHKFEVCYQSVENPLLCPWVRTLDEWNEMVMYENENVKRFSIVD